MRMFQADTMTQLHDHLCETIVHSPKDQLDVISSVDVQIHNTISQADRMEWDFDLKNMWLTKSRWSMMARQYIDPEELRIWLEKCSGTIGLKGRGIGMLRTKTVAARGGAATGHTNKETRRWGSCMLGLSYKAKPVPQITLYSRTSYLGYLAALDLSVAWMCARYLADAIGCPVESFRFVWMNEALQYHNFKSLAYLLNHPDPEQAKMYRRIIVSDKKKYRDLAGEKHPIDQEHLTPALWMSRKWMSNIRELDDTGKTLGDMNYNTYRRIRRRYHTEVLGYEVAQTFEGASYYKVGPKTGEEKEFFKAYLPLPNVDVHTLDFSPIGMPIGGGYGVEYDEAADTEEDDDE
jgi:hypothetical protein